MKTPERRQWYRFGVFIVNLERISHLFLVFVLFVNFEPANISWVTSKISQIF